MNILNLEHVTKRYVSKEIIEDVTVGIEDTDKIGVVGISGTGKSTFLSIVAGVVEPDEGQVIKRSGLRISYLAQDPVFDESRTVLENVQEAIERREDYWNTTGEARSMLLRFGIADPDISPDKLSGGQRKRAALVAAILTPCDLLILDEPTNHLDLAMINWLQDYLQNYRGAVLLVTHDRYFLDSVTTQTIELDRGKAYRYEGGYSEYLAQKQERLNFARAAERKMAALYRQDLAWMMRGARARSTKQKAHIARFEMLRDREKIVEERQAQLSSLPSRLGNKIIEIENISKSYGDRKLFHDFSYLMGKTDRIGIIGENGCGKSTLLKCLIGEILPDEGSVEIGQTVQIGYFGQENDLPDDKQRVIDYIKDTAEYVRTADGLTSASNMCNQFLFDPEMQFSQVGKLSGGEKRRLCLLKVLMESPNVLILDEPTNDLDIQTLQILEDYLDHFAGVIIVVSHDRYFLDRVVTRIFAFGEDGTLLQSEGGFSDYLLHGGYIPGAEEAVRKAQEVKNAKGGNAGKAVAAKASEGGLSGEWNDGENNAYAAGNQTAANDGNSIGTEVMRDSRGRIKQPKKKLSYKEQKEYDSIEGEIEELEEKSARLEEEMIQASTDYPKLAALTKEKEETDALLEQKMERYIELQDLVDSFQN